MGPPALPRSVVLAANDGMLIRAATLSLDERVVDVTADECRVQICKDGGVPILDANSSDGSTWEPLKTSADSKCTCHFKYAANDPNASHFAAVDETDKLTFRVLGRRKGSDERYAWTLGLASEGAKALLANFYNDCAVRLPPDEGDTTHGRAFGALIVKAKLMPRAPIAHADRSHESVAEGASAAIQGGAPSSTKTPHAGAQGVVAAAAVRSLAHADGAPAHASVEQASPDDARLSPDLPQPLAPPPAAVAPARAGRGSASRGTEAPALDGFNSLASLRHAVVAEDKEVAHLRAEVADLETKMAELQQLSAGVQQELDGAQSALRGGRADVRAARLHQARELKAHVALQLDNTHRMLAAILDETEDFEERLARKQRR